MPTNRTLARIEVFFASGDPRQKTDFKSPLRGQKRLFQQTARFNVNRAVLSVGFNF